MRIPDIASSAQAKRLYAFQFIGICGSIFYGFFYSIFLYREFMNVSMLVIENLVAGISLWLGFIFGSYLINKTGHVKAAKMSFMLFGANAVATAVFIGNIRDLYMVFGFARGVAGGVMLAVAHSYLLSAIKGTERNRYFYVSHAMEMILGVILPAAIGFLIVFFEGYRVMFIVSGAVYLLGVLIRFGEDEKHALSLSRENFFRIIRHDVFKEFSANKILMAGADTMNALLMGIVPFLILQNEFSVGVLASVTALFAAIFSFLSRNSHSKRQIKMGYTGSFLRLILNASLVFFWVTPALIIRNITMGTVSVLTDPVVKNTNMGNKEAILGGKKIGSGLEINLIDETLVAMGSVAALAPFLLIMALLGPGSQITAIKVLLIIYAAWKIAHFFWILRIQKKLTVPVSSAPEPVVVPAA